MADKTQELIEQINEELEANEKGMTSTHSCFNQLIKDCKAQLTAQADELLALKNERKALSNELLREDEYTQKISKAHPLETGDHVTYSKAVELVSNRHDKYDLVDLVNCILQEKATQADEIKRLSQPTIKTDNTQVIINLEAEIKRLREIVEDISLKPCETLGLDDYEDGCCTPCRARKLLNEVK